MMQIISSNIGLKFEEVCHKGMTGIWKKILNDAIYKKTSFIGYDSLPFVLRKLYSAKTPYLEHSDSYCDVEEGNEDEEFDRELLEYKENSYDQYVDLLEQKSKERKDDSVIDIDCNNVYLNNKEKSSDLAKQEIIRKYKGVTVLSPHRGLHHDVYIFDVTSLYHL